MDRKKLIEHLRSVIHVNGHMLTVAVGNGISAKCCIEGGADLLTAMNAGRIRQMAQSAFAAFFSYSEANQMSLDFGSREVIPVADGFPVLCGVCMQDPCIHLYNHFQRVKDHGFSGVINYPTFGFANGRFGRALDNSSLGYDKEIEGIGIAHFLDLFTMAYVFNKEQALAMADAGADAIILHFGIVGGGTVGASEVISLEKALMVARDVMDAVHEKYPQVIRLVAGGPIQTPLDAFPFYENTRTEGLMAGSIVERIPVERAITNTSRAFKSQGDFSQENIISRVLNDHNSKVDYGQFVEEYIIKNYNRRIQLKDLSEITHVSGSYLSLLFKKKTGKSFTRYLMDYRMDMARELMRTSDKQMKEISSLVGYEDYSQFEKLFRREVGMAPLDYRKSQDHARAEKDKVGKEE